MEQKGDTNVYLLDYRRLTAEILDVNAPNLTFEQRLETYLLISSYAGKVPHICKSSESFFFFFFLELLELFGIFFLVYIAGWIQILNMSANMKQLTRNSTPEGKINLCLMLPPPLSCCSPQASAPSLISC